MNDLYNFDTFMINEQQLNDFVYKKNKDNFLVRVEDTYITIEQQSILTNEYKKIIIGKDEMLPKLIEFLQKIK